MSNYETQAAACRGRQQRLIDSMRQQQIDAVIVTQAEHVQWLAGPRFPWVMQAAAALRVDGHLTLAAPKKPILNSAADEVVTYEAQWHSTLRNDQRRACMELLESSVGEKV
ncbi:MAG: aminopeptidase P family N-terminal domain-containing protein, partial [Planctomycetia bacterium]|nr:aminopeptidase P family N-terminal domain-containing protein [Planctomycetia bacterium]